MNQKLNYKIYNPKSKSIKGINRGNFMVLN